MKPTKADEKKVLAIIALVFGGIALVTSWMPFINNGSAILAIIGLILGVIALILNRKNKKVISLVSIAVAVVAFIIVLVTQASYGAAIDSALKSTDSESNTVKTSSSSSTKESKYSLKSLNELAKNTKSVDEFYVTGKLKVSDKGDIKPGIYDVTITGGSGSITGERGNDDLSLGAPISWAGASLESGLNMDYPSTIRMILFEGDSIEFSDISKIKLTAVGEKVTKSNKLGVGNYVVGRDIKAGTYKLSTNITMDAELENLGWDIDIYNPSSKESKSQTLDPGNNDVVVKLKDGDIITTDLYNTGEGVTADDARLIFTATDN